MTKSSNLYDKYRQDKTKLNQIREKLRYLEQLSPEEQNNKYFKQEISKEIWEKKYKAITDNSIVDTWKRVAKFIAQAEKPEERETWYLYFFDLLEGFKFLPGGRITYGSDPNKKKITSLNCFIGGKIEDSMEGIMKELTNAVMTLKSGGGYGNNFSTLRPKGSLIHSTGGQSSGVLSFMHIWDEAAKQIRMGNSRRSAMMGILNVDHPEIEDFINAKDRVGFDVPLGFFNLSIGIVDGFMDAVINDDKWELKFNNKVHKTVKARDLFKKAIEHSLINGEPGILFLDNMQWRNNLYYIPEEKIISTNPCSEISGSNFTSCLLGSFNLSQFVDNPFANNNSFDFDKFYYYIPIAVRFLDNVIDTSEYPLEEYKEKEQKYRLMGLGLTALGDVLTMMQMKYVEKKSLSFVEELLRYYVNSAYNASVELAKERGSFTGFIPDKYIQSNFIQTAINSDVINNIKKYGIRNSSLMAIAPVGTGSLFANNISFGIEPIFANEYNRRMRTNDGSSIKSVVQDYAYYLWKEKFGNKSLPSYWTTTKDITFKQHVDILVTIQKYIDKSCSKTCIIRKKPTVDEMISIYIDAWKNKLNGITVFYPTAKTELVLETKDNTGSTSNTNSTSLNDSIISGEGRNESTVNSTNNNNPKNNNQKTNNIQNTNKKKKRGFMLDGKTYKLKTPKEKYKYYVTINNFIDDEGNLRPFEIFINTKDPRQPIFSFIARLLSALFRRERNLDFIIKEMQSTLVHGEGFFDQKDGKHVPSTIAYIGKIIKYHIDQMKNSDSNDTTMPNELYTQEENNVFFIPSLTSDDESDKMGTRDTSDEDSPFEICPECGMRGLKVENGCKTCIYCGYSRCQ